MIIILTYQDYEREITDRDKKSFIIKAINEYKSSVAYTDAEAAQLYYKRQNKEIMKRLGYLERTRKVKINVVFHKLCSGFFPKFVKQLSQYLLGNGVSIDEKQKEKLGSKFDKTLQTMGINALVDGVCWGFWNIDRLISFRATEFFALMDERTGDPRVGIRFWQIDINKPMYIELFEEDGITGFRAKGNSKPQSLEEISPKTAYKQTIRKDMVSTEIVGVENYGLLPVFPLYANELKQSELDHGLKGMIDAYDFINSDLSDGITQSEGIYWAIKNFGGADAQELVREMEQWRATVNDGDAGAQSFVIEIPFNAKQYALDLLEKRMYADFMALDMRALTGGSLTNVAINVAKTDLDLKADIFEWQVADFVENILKLIRVTDFGVVKFKRRSITNDSETIDNISTMLTDGYVDIDWAIDNCPVIADEDREQLKERLMLQSNEEANRTFPTEETEEDQSEVIANG